jgi:hypothetical protein
VSGRYTTSLSDKAHAEFVKYVHQVVLFSASRRGRDHDPFLFSSRGTIMGSVGPQTRMVNGSCRSPLMESWTHNIAVVVISVYNLEPTCLHPLFKSCRYAIRTKIRRWLLAVTILRVLYWTPEAEFKARPAAKWKSLLENSRTKLMQSWLSKEITS